MRDFYEKGRKTELINQKLTMPDYDETRDHEEPYED